MDIQQLLYPQLLPNEILRNVLKERCIQVEEIDKLDKVMLIDLFKRVALPLPQRKYNDKVLGKKMQNLRSSRNIKVADCDENQEISTTVTDSSLNNKKSQSDCSHQSSRLKPPLSDTNEITKKIRLSNSEKTSATEQHEIKRKNDVPLKTDSKKRKKIMWP